MSVCVCVCVCVLWIYAKPWMLHSWTRYGIFRSGSVSNTDQYSIIGGRRVSQASFVTRGYVISRDCVIFDGVYTLHGNVGNFVRSQWSQSATPHLSSVSRVSSTRIIARRLPTLFSPPLWFLVIREISLFAVIPVTQSIKRNGILPFPYVTGNSFSPVSGISTSFFYTLCFTRYSL